MGDPDGDEITEAPLSNVAPSLSIEEQNTDEESKQEKEKNPEKKKLGFGFKCGLDGHKIWNCRGKPNPELVCKRFEDNQGN